VPRLGDDLPFILRRENTARYSDGEVLILDRRAYPAETRFECCGNPAEVARAIREMVTQGAGPAFAAGLAVAQAARVARDRPRERALDLLAKAAAAVSEARPTNRAPAAIATRIAQVAEAALEAGEDPEVACLDAVDAAYDRYFERCQRIGEHAAGLLRPAGDLLTHCFAEALLVETLRQAREAEHDFELYVPETRPYLQGARLTAAAVREIGVPVTVLPDASVGALLSTGRIQALLTAADSVTLDGHVANKSGTYLFALAARAHEVPFYVLCFGPDRERADRDSLMIEERDPSEVLKFRGEPTAAPGVGAWYPAFDVTPPELISAYVTHRGAFEHPAALAAWGDEREDSGSEEEGESE